MQRMTDTTPATGPITLAIDARSVDLAVTAVPGLSEASVQVTGPAKVVDGVRAERVGDRWTITVPAPPTTASGLAVYGIQARGNVVVSDGDIVMSGGRTIINGFEINPNVRKTDPVRVTACVPAGSSVSAPTLGTGEAALNGNFDEVSLRTTTGDVLLAGTAHSVTAATSTGNIVTQGRTTQAHATSVTGHITIERADGLTRARSDTGNLTVLAAGPGLVTAESTTGDVHVGGTRMYAVDVQAHTRTGHRHVS